MVEASRAALDFLFESRLQVRRDKSAAQHCATATCACVVTGLAASHCCKVCAREPGRHGPLCEQRLVQCAGCDFATSGLAPGFCCRKCAGEADTHGPHCLRVLVAASCEEDDGEEAEPQEDDPEYLEAAEPGAGELVAAEAQQPHHRAVSSAGSSSEPVRVADLASAQRALQAAQRRLSGVSDDEEALDDLDPNRPPDPELVRARIACRPST